MLKIDNWPSSVVDAIKLKRCRCLRAVMLVSYDDDLRTVPEVNVLLGVFKAEQSKQTIFRVPQYYRRITVLSG